MVGTDFKVKHIKFGDNIEGVQVTYGELTKPEGKQFSCAFSYDLSNADSNDYNEKIEICKQELLKEANNGM